MLPFRNNRFHYTDCFPLLQQGPARRNDVSPLCLTKWPCHSFPSFPLLPEQTRKCFSFRLTGFFSPCCRRNPLPPTFSRCSQILCPIVLACRPSVTSPDHCDLPLFPPFHQFCESSWMPHPYCLPPSVRWWFSSMSATFLQLLEIRCFCPAPCSPHRNGHKLWGGPSHRLPSTSNLSFFTNSWCPLLFVSFKKVTTSLFSCFFLGQVRL